MVESTSRIRRPVGGFLLELLGRMVPKRFLLILLLAGCSTIGGQTPSNIEDACSIVRQKPAWNRAMKNTERTWGIPVSVQMAIIYQESKFEAKARPPRKYFLGFIPTGHVTSAYGYGQAIDGTWKWYKDDAGRFGARRDNFADASDFIGWYSDISAKQLGLSKRDTQNLYLAYHEGHAGYKRGSYRSKAWLMEVARSVDRVERRYRSQLRGCNVA
ncbi:MAG: lytic transglycosylase [Rhodobacteraceae bacterium]|nr:lytic transglycosylase [Paracoccaceae bacterium]